MSHMSHNLLLAHWTEVVAELNSLHLSLLPGSRFQQLGGDPEWAARQGKRRDEQRRRGSDSDGSDSEVEEDGVLQRTGQCRLHSQVLPSHDSSTLRSTEFIVKCLSTSLMIPAWVLSSVIIA